jgi:hypothetical protein
MDVSILKKSYLVAKKIKQEVESKRTKDNHHKCWSDVDLDCKIPLVAQIAMGENLCKH